MDYMNTNSWLSQYGIDPTIDDISCPEIQREKIRCKIEVIDWCAWMHQTLEQIERSFRGAPLDMDEEHLRIMQEVRDKVKRASIDLNEIVRSYMK